MLRRATLTGIVAAFAALSYGDEATKGVGVRLVEKKENVVASELMGEWVLDADVSKRLGGRSDHFGEGPLVFSRNMEAEGRVLRDLAALAERLTAEKKDPETVALLDTIGKVYLAGELQAQGRRWDFALVGNHGNPYLLFHDRKENWEGEHVMFARDDAGDNDLLFLGGDFNNQSFGAYKRAPKGRGGTVKNVEETRKEKDWTVKDLPRNPRGNAVIPLSNEVILRNSRKLLEEHPDDHELKAQIVHLATTLARPQAPSPAAWQILIDQGVLRDGMPRDTAYRLLGPPTYEKQGEVQWYFNHEGWHVFPGLAAELEDGKLKNWLVFEG